MFHFFKKQVRLKTEELELEPIGEKTGERCPRCNNITRTVWGAVYRKEKQVGAYFVNWTQDSAKHGARFDLVLGEWGEKSAACRRKIVSLEYQAFDGRSGFMIIDADSGPLMDSQLATHATLREEVVGTGLAQDGFAVVDAIWVGDARISEITRWGEEDA